MSIKIGYAGDRFISVEILSFILEQGITPSVLLVSNLNRASHRDELISLCNHLDDSHIINGSEIRKPETIEKIKQENLDYLICVHFPYIIPSEILNLPRIGVLNLHPAFLPFNRGWNTPSWAILDNTPYGATLHFIDESLDTGDIICQKLLEISVTDTADSLYKKVLTLEKDVFLEAWLSLVDMTFERKSQKSLVGSAHKKNDLKTIQKIALDEKMESRRFIDILRALTTNDIEEAAYFEIDGERYRLQLTITKDTL